MIKQSFKIAALGDIMLDRDVGQHYFSKPDDFRFEQLESILCDQDLVIANLENPVGLRGSPHPKQDPHVAFRCHPETLQILKNLNIDVVTLANNHLLDYGSQTLMDTLLYLDAVDIKHLGAGKDYSQANAPVLQQINGINVAILSSVMIYSASTQRATKSSPGVADYAIGPLLKVITQLKAKGYVVIVTIHWGIEYCFYPIPYQRSQAMQMIDVGASLIIGHGPHYPQGIEDYRNGKIVHSLGNFIFDEPYPNSKRTFIFSATVDASGIIEEYQIYPLRIENHVPVIDEDGMLGRTAIIVTNLGKIYQRKSAIFWKKINSRWFSDIVSRISSMGSVKFALLPPVSFYFDIGIGNYRKKLRIQNLKWALGLVVRKLTRKN